MRANALITRMLLVGSIAVIGGPVPAALAQDVVPTTTTDDVPSTSATTAPAAEMLPASEIAAATQPAIGDDDLITIDLPEDLPLKSLAEAVARELKINIIYDEQIVQAGGVTVRVPKRIPRGTLLWLLDSTLQMKGLTLVDAGRPGWKKVVRPNNLPAVASPTTQPAQMGVVTQFFNLSQADASRVADTVRPFLTVTPAAGSVFAVVGTRQLVVSDYAPVVDRIATIVEWLDKGDPDILVEYVPLERGRASQVQQTIQQALQKKEQAQFGAAVERVFSAADERTNQVMLIGPAGRVAEARAIGEKLDAPLNLTTKVYRFRAISPDTVDELFQDVLGEDGPELDMYRSSVSEEAGALVVSTTEDLHKRLDALAKELDIVGEQSPLKFYKLRNAVAADVLSTIAGLEGEGGTGGFTPGDDTADGGFYQSGGGSGLTGSGAGTIGNASGSVGAPTGNTGQPNQPGMSNQYTRGMPPQGFQQAQQGSTFNTGSGAFGTGGSSAAEQSGGRRSRRSGGTSGGSFAGGNRGVLDASGRAGAGQPVSAVRGRNAVFTADVNTNSIIVIAPPPVQKLYEELIKRLDVRRPQVQVEVTIATLDTSNGFSLGVDLGITGGFDDGDGDILTFSQNGLSTVQDGRLVPIVGRGLNVAILNPNIADVVIRALATSSRSRLTSMPQVLVNDNETGLLQSIQEVPYTSIVRDTTDTTSETVGGFVEAGTAIEVTPHISEDDYLAVDYSIELSSFGSQANSNLPPPTQRNNVASSVTVPDGHTIVVGGLSTKSLTESLSGIPVLRKIPILGALFSTQRNDTADTTLFIFIRPAILRDDKFRDLRFYSDRALEQAGVQGDYPESKPVLMR